VGVQAHCQDRSCKVRKENGSFPGYEICLVLFSVRSRGGMEDNSACDTGVGAGGYRKAA